MSEQEKKIEQVCQEVVDYLLQVKHLSINESIDCLTISINALKRAKEILGGE